MLAGKDEEGAKRRKRAAADAGLLSPLVRALALHKGACGVQQHGCRALAILCTGADAASEQRRLQGVNAGAIGAVVGGLLAHCDAATGAASSSGVSQPSDGPRAALLETRAREAAAVMDGGVAALQLLTASAATQREQAMRAGAVEEWLEGSWRRTAVEDAPLPPPSDEATTQVV